MIPLINQLLSSSKLALRVVTQDWHPSDHVSFASNHPPPNNKPLESYVEVRNLVADRPHETMQQRLWPIHCVQNTNGAELVEGLSLDKVDIFIKKGSDARVEMYSAFADSFGNLTAGEGGVSHDLAQIFKENSITDVHVVGVAGDYCVKCTAIDASKAGFKVFVIDEAVRSVDPNTWSDVKKEFDDHRVQVVSVDGPEVKGILAQ
jgi:nicotinamidase-related amidase